MDKQKALEAALAQIEKLHGKGSIMRLGANERIEVEALSTGSLGLDIALGIGGLPRGRIVEIYGPESSGKTTMTLHVVAEAQKRGGVCAFIDAEHALDVGYAKKLGVKTDELVGDLEGLLAVVGLRHEQVLGAHAQLARVADVERVLGVDEGAHAARALCLREDRKSVV